MTGQALGAPHLAPPRPEAVPAGRLAGQDVDGLEAPDTDLTLPPGREAVVRTDDGARLAVTVAGAPSTGRAPVVLPHCWTGTRAVGVPVARRLLAAGHQVVLYDQRGHGESSTGTDPISVERLGDDLATVVDHLDLTGAVLAGHSMGGMTVMSFACRHTEAAREWVRGLALVATAAHGLGAAGRDRFWRTTLRRDHLNRLVDVPALVLLGRRDTLVVNSLTRAIVDHLSRAPV